MLSLTRSIQDQAGNELTVAFCARFTSRKYFQLFVEATDGGIPQQSSTATIGVTVPPGVGGVGPTAGIGGDGSNAVTPLPQQIQFATREQTYGWRGNSQ